MPTALNWYISVYCTTHISASRIQMYRKRHGIKGLVKCCECAQQMMIWYKRTFQGFHGLRTFFQICYTLVWTFNVYTFVCVWFCFFFRFAILSEIDKSDLLENRIEIGHFLPNISIFCLPQHSKVVKDMNGMLHYLCILICHLVWISFRCITHLEWDSIWLNIRLCFHFREQIYNNLTKYFHIFFRIKFIHPLNNYFIDTIDGWADEFINSLHFPINLFDWIWLFVVNRMNWLKKAD